MVGISDGTAVATSTTPTGVGIAAARTLSELETIPKLRSLQHVYAARNNYSRRYTSDDHHHPHTHVDPTVHRVPYRQTWLAALRLQPGVDRRRAAAPRRKPSVYDRLDDILRMA
jgi:hypothetical protein